MNTVLMVVLFISLSSVLVYAIPTEHYLHYHRTTFDTDNWFTSFDDTVINTTEKVLKIIDVTVPVPKYENFNDGEWAITGGNPTIDSDYVITFNGDMRYSTNRWIYKIENTGTSWTYTWKMNVDSIVSDAATIRGTIFMTGSSIEDFRNHLNTNNEAIACTLESSLSTTEYWLKIRACENADSRASDSTAMLDVDTDYYILMNRTFMDIGLYVYSDEAMTTLVSGVTLDLTDLFGSDYNLQRMYALSNYGATSSLQSKVTMSNLWNQSMVGALPLTGTAYTKNLLENVTYPTDIGFSLMINSTVPSGCGVQVDISNDNSSWITVINNGGGYGWGKIEKYNYSTLFAKFTLTTNGIDNVEVIDFWFTHFTHDLGAGGQIVSGAWNATLPSSQEAVVATIEGNNTHLEAVDGKILNITEVVGTPAFSAEFNFTIPDNVINLNLNLYGVYEGNIAHNVTIEAWNYDTSQWIILGALPDAVSMKWYNMSLSIYPSSHFIENNILHTRIHHYGAGNINHDVHIDYFKARYFEPSGVVITSTSNAATWFSAFIFIVFPILVTMMKKMRMV